MITNGTLQVADAAPSPVVRAASNLSLTGTLDLDGSSVTIDALTGRGTVTNNGPGTSTLTVGTDNQTSQFAGTIADGSGSVALVKVGAGTLTLTGKGNAYSGGTTVSAGVLDAPGPGDLPYCTPGGGVSVAPRLPSRSRSWSARIPLIRGTSCLDALLANPDFTTGNLELDLISADADAMPSLADITSGIPFTFSTDKLGNRSLIVTGNSYLQLTGSGHYHGGLTLDGGGTLFDPAAPNGGLSLAGAGLVVAGGAILDLNGASPTVSTLDLLDGQIAGNPGDTLTAASYNVEEGQVSVNLAGGTLTKIGTGADDTVTLNGTDGYTGLTTVYGGACSLAPAHGQPRSTPARSSMPEAWSSTTAGPPPRWRRCRRPPRPAPIQGSPTISDNRTAP